MLSGSFSRYWADSQCLRPWDRVLVVVEFKDTHTLVKPNLSQRNAHDFPVGPSHAGQLAFFQRMPHTHHDAKTSRSTFPTLFSNCNSTFPSGLGISPSQTLWTTPTLLSTLVPLTALWWLDVGIYLETSTLDCAQWGHLQSLCWTSTWTA